MSARDLIEAFGRWRAAHSPLVLATVIETEGSTYTKPGHRILIAGDGRFQGLVSGGCLEGDLAEHARTVLDTGRPELLTYDLRDEHDDIWGLGIGCNGLFRVLLQPLLPDDGYAPFADIAATIGGETAAGTASAVAVVAESDCAELPPGATVVATGTTPRFWQVPAAWREPLVAASGRAGHDTTCTLRLTVAGYGARVLCAPLRPLPRLLVLGAGLDAVPLVEFARRLGWRVTVVDHRAGHLARGDLGAADHCVEIAPAVLGTSLDVAAHAAAVVMSHHLDTDRAWLRELARSTVPYVGVLGPAARGARLLAELGADADALRPRLHSPVGLPIGADSPESIALSILAEVQASLHTAAGSA